MNKNIPWLIVGIAGFILLFLVENMGLRMVEEMANGQSDPMLFRLYPSFPIKLQTMGLERVQEYLFQIKYRWLLLIGFTWFLSTNMESPKVAVPDLKSLQWKVRLFFGVQLVYLPDLFKEITLRNQWKAFYTPLPFFSKILPTFPSIWLLQFLVVFAFAVCAFFILSKWTPSEKLPAWIALAGFLFWTVLLLVFFGYSKIDHTYASLYSGYIFMVIWLFYWKRFPEEGWIGFRLFQAGIWGCYFFSGLEKVFLSGIHWISTEHFQTLCWLHPGTLCEPILSVPFLPELLLTLVLVFQLTTFLQWRFPWWGYVTAIGGLIFHLSTWLVLDVGGWQSPWILMLVFLLPIGKKTATKPSGTS